MDDSDHRTDEQDDIDEQELKRRFYERLSDWSEPGSVKINRNGKLVDPPVVSDQIKLSDGSNSLTDGCKEHMI